MAQELCPLKQVADLPPEAFPIDDGTAGLLLRHAATPINCSTHPSKFFKRFRLIAESTTAKIYIAREVSNGRDCVVKKLRIRDNPVLQSYVEMELAMSMLCTNCPQIVEFRSVILTQKNVWLIMEHLAGGCVSRIFLQGALRERAIAYVMKSVLLGLQYMHSRHRIHRDLKAHNVLVSAEGAVKIIDFGWAVQLTQSQASTTLPVGSVYWMAPEVHSSADYGCSADIWSLGILLLELAVNEPPHYNIPHESAALMIMSNPAPTLQNLPEHMWSKDILSFLNCCLQKNPWKRWSADQLLAHPFIVQAYNDEQWQQELAAKFPRWPNY